MLHQGDCINALDFFEEESVDLIYLDPPFFMNNRRFQKEGNEEEAQEKAKGELWSSPEEYSKYIQDRFEVCKKLLSPNGTVFLNCDYRVSHHLRFAMDNVFGPENFQSEIIWSYKRFAHTKRNLLNCHQSIYFYSKGSQFRFNRLFQEGPQNNRDQGNNRNFNRNFNGNRGNGRGHQNNDRRKMMPLSDVWEIPYLGPKSKERVGYPTQKPIHLLNRIIKLVTVDGDLVFDPFCGSGTTLVAAKQLRRTFIGMDTSEEAISLTRKRLDSAVVGEATRNNKRGDSSQNQPGKIQKILKELNASPVQRNKGIDGLLKMGGVIDPIPVKVQREGENLEDAKMNLIKACKKDQYDKKVLINIDGEQFFEKELNMFHYPRNKVEEIDIEDFLNP